MTGVVEHAAPATAAPWPATFPDGTALPTVTGGTTPRTATKVGDLTGAADGSLVTYTGPPLSTLTINGRKDCTFRGLRFAAGATFEVKDCENVVVEPERREE